MTNPTPIYTSNQADPAYCLRFSWTGFPSGRSFTGLPSPELLREIAPLWEEDGIRLLENYWSDENLAFLHGQQAIWNSGLYVGTFGEYNMQAIRSNASPQLTVVGSSRVDRRRAV